jgi:predicted ribosome quality control (RQC) complex YloA/Tae2 family protein
MSLNFKEIDLVLTELDLPGMWIQKIFQPSYDTIVIGLYGNSSGKKDILISVAAGACRLHSLSALPAKNERPLRFMECLRSRIKGGRIESAQQIAGDRIVKFSIRMPLVQEAETDPSVEDRAQAFPVNPVTAPLPATTYTLYARLWSGAGNILLVDETGTIVDALFRKPEKRETSGLPCRIESDALSAQTPEESQKKAEKFTVRELPGTGSFSDRVEAYYSSVAGELSRDNLLKKAAERFDSRMKYLENKEAEISAKLDDYRNSERYRQIGDILMAGNFSSAAPGDSSKGSGAFVETFDFFTDKPISIRINAKLGAVENAKLYYEKYKKANSGLADVEAELEKNRVAKAQLQLWHTKLKNEQDPFAIAQALEKAGTVRETPLRKFPCICIEEKGWTILVGRSAKENDDLLRRFVKGSDLWLHARDYSGSYIFIKAQKNKSFPLDLMLDAAMLAIYYSKARKNTEGNVYYTHAKYLRRVKDGPKGLVIPSMEKNLFVRVDSMRLKALLANSTGGDS